MDRRQLIERFVARKKKRPYAVAKGGGNPYGAPLPDYGNLPPARKPSRAGSDIAQGAFKQRDRMNRRRPRNTF